MRPFVLFYALLLAFHASYPTVSAASEIYDGMTLALRGTNTNACAVTFDDGPSPHTSRLLDILKERNIRATFFVLGSRVAKYPLTMEKMILDGHEVGNHTFNHVNLRHLDPTQQREEITKTDSALREMGVTPRYLRPPYGRYDTETLKIADQENLILAFWSVDSRDSQRARNAQGANASHNAATKPPHGVFLFHDVHRVTVDAMPTILDTLAQAGCRFVTLTEYIETSGPVCME